MRTCSLLGFHLIINACIQVLTGKGIYHILYTGSNIGDEIIFILKHEISHL